MITYTKRGWGLGLLFRVYGSAIPRSCPVALASTALAVWLSLYQVPQTIPCVRCIEALSWRDLLSPRH